MRLNVLALVFSLSGLSMLSGCTESKPATLTPQSIAARNKPGTVLLRGKFTSTLTAPRLTLNEEQMTIDMTTLVTNFVNGLSEDEKTALSQIQMLPQDQQEALQNKLGEALAVVFIRQLVERSEKYFIQDRENPISTKVSIRSTGSGFLLTPDGYIVTNAHVVSPSSESLKQHFIREGLSTYKDEMVESLTAILRLAEAVHVEIQREQRTRIMERMLEIYQEHVTVSSHESVIEATLGYFGNGGSAKWMSCDVVQAGKEIPGKDVAILKLSGHNLPTLPMSSETVRSGDPMHVIGYPGKVTFSDTFSEESQSEPSLTQGTVSSVRDMKGGWQVIQTDAAIAPGNSGGPALDQKGHVVGIATFQIKDSDEESGQSSANFVVPNDVIREFLTSANIKPQRSLFNVKYEEALQEYEQEYYTDALKLFQEADRLVPNLRYVRDYVSECQAKSGTERDKTWRKKIPYYAGGGILALTSIGVVFLVRRRRLAPPIQQ